jgi:hypothetical protein
MIENEGCFSFSASDVRQSRLKSRNRWRSNFKVIFQVCEILITALLTEVAVVVHDLNPFQLGFEHLNILLEERL